MDRLPQATSRKELVIRNCELALGEATGGKPPAEVGRLFQKVFPDFPTASLQGAHEIKTETIGSEYEAIPVASRFVVESGHFFKLLVTILTGFRRPCKMK
jgi:hypothetical protein